MIMHTIKKILNKVKFLKMLSEISLFSEFLSVENSKGNSIEVASLS